MSNTIDEKVNIEKQQNEKEKNNYYANMNSINDNSQNRALEQSISNNKNTGSGNFGVAGKSAAILAFILTRLINSVLKVGIFFVIGFVIIMVMFILGL